MTKRAPPIFPGITVTVHVPSGLDGALPRNAAQQIATGRIVPIFENGLRAAVATLRDMVGVPGEYGACKLWP